MSTRYKTIIGRVTSGSRQRLAKLHLDEVLRSHHLARDIGLRHRPSEPRKLGQW